jgi:serine/threonine protein kinase
MALPQLNSTPSYRITIPSLGKKTTFRPFLVKEQKALLIAYETQDKTDMVRAITRTIHACIEEPIEANLTTFDVDYLFTQIRAKSVGEVVDLSIKCEECNMANDISIELDDIQMSKETQSDIIKLTDEVSLKMRYPSYDDFLSNEKLLETDSMTESLMELIMVCLDSVLTEEERFSIKDESKEDVINFIDSMTSDQFERVTEFVQNMPAISKDVEFTCVSCKHENKRTLQGMDDFF